MRASSLCPLLCNHQRHRAINFITIKTMRSGPRSLDQLVEAAIYSLRRMPELPDLACEAYEIMLQGRLYERENDLETAYILYRRAYALAQEMPRHPHYATALPILKDQFVYISTHSLMDAERLRFELHLNHSARSASQLPKSTPPSHLESKQNRQGEQSSVLGSALRKQTETSIRSQASTSHVSERLAVVPRERSPADTPTSPPPTAPNRPSSKRTASMPHERSPSSPQATTSNIPYSTDLDQRTNQGSLSSRRPFKSVSQVPEGHSPRPFRPSNTTRVQQHRTELHPLPEDVPHSPSSGPEAFITPRSLPSSSPNGLISSSSERPKNGNRPPPPRGIALSPIFEISANQTARQQGSSTLQLSPRLRRVEGGHQPHPLRSAPTEPMHEGRGRIHQSSSPSRSPRTLPTSAVLPSSPRTPTSPAPPQTRKRHASPIPVSANQRAIAANTSGTTVLRTVIIPRNLIEEFTVAVTSNTIHNIETCAWIMGVLTSNVFIATVIVIPKQIGTSNTCTTTNEEEVLSIADAENLYILGWIHTHPQHDLFMSSIDLHTQASYQQMLPEAIAVIVCPEADEGESEVGIFRLTDPQGLLTISRCQLGPGFHSHPNTTLYTSAEAGKVEEAEGNGHVKISPAHLTPGQTRLIDMR